MCREKCVYVDIEEGGSHSKIPDLGFGRVLSRPDLDEHYISYTECGIKTLVATLSICGKRVQRMSQWIVPDKD